MNSENSLLLKTTIKKETLEWLFLLTLFFASFFHSFLLLVFILSSLLLFLQKEKGALKIIIILALRSIINSGIAVEMGSLQTLKLLIIMLASVYLIFSYFKLNKEKRSQLKWILMSLALFLGYNIFVAFFSSSLPVISTSKVLSFGIGITGVLIGTAYVIDKMDIFKWMTRWFKIIFFISLFMIPLPVGYLVNGTAFQGVISHPNMFGIVGALFVAMILGKNSDIRKMKKNDYFFLISAILMISLSNSRTGLISALVIILLFVVVQISFRPTALKLAALSFSGALLIFLYQPLMAFAKEYIAKGQDLDNLLYSRRNQIGDLLFNFQQKPFIGNGFGVPALPFKSYQFSMDFVVEPGNIILALLSFSGIIGFSIFVIFLFSVLLSNKRNMIYKFFLLVAPFIVSMGEMVFFSTNSVGVFCYMLIAMYMFYDKDNNKAKTSL